MERPLNWVKSMRRGPCRRRLLLGGAALGAGLVLPRVSAARSEVPTPAQTPGPFYPTRRPIDADHNLLRGAGIKGARGLAVAGQVRGRDGKPLSGAMVELWQSDPHGRYLDDVGPNGVSMGFKGYGRVLTRRAGLYAFETVFPGVYPGRAPHLHFAVRRPDFGLFTTQMYFKGQPGNEHDFLLRRIGSDAQRKAVIADASTGEARFDIVLNV